MQTAADERHGRRLAAGAAIALLGLVAAANAPDVSGLWNTWRGSYSYEHGIAVALVIPWLVWHARDQLAFEPSVPWWRGLALLAALELAWAFAFGAHVDVVRYALLPCLVFAAVRLLLGPVSARRLVFPLAWFWCAVALWDGLAEPLQRLSSVVNEFVLGAIGIPTLRAGTVLTVPAGSFEVTLGCSGLNFLLVAVSLAALVGYVRHWRAGARWLLVGVAAGVALVSNWLRIAITIGAGQWTHMQSRLVLDEHIEFGWWVFAAALVVFLIVALRFPAPLAAPAAAAPASPATLRAAAPRIAAVAALLAVGPLIALWQEREPEDRITMRLPEAVSSWQGPVDGDTAWSPAFIGASSRAHGQYQGPSASVVVDLTYYARQGRGGKLLGYGSRPEGPVDARLVGTALVRRAGARGGPRSVQEAIVDLPRGQRWLVWHWYQAGRWGTGDPLQFRLYEGWRGLEGRSGAAAVSVAVACANGCSGREQAALGSFLDAMEARLAGAAAAGSSAGSVGGDAG